QNWLLDYNKFVVKEREDPNFHFSFFIWPDSKKKSLIPILLGLLKKPINGREIFLIGIGWDVDKKSEVVMAVINDSLRTIKLVTALKTIINPQNYNLGFLPSEQKIDTIKIARPLLIDYLNPDLLFK